MQGHRGQVDAPAAPHASKARRTQTTSARLINNTQAKLGAQISRVGCANRAKLAICMSEARQMHTRAQRGGDSC